MVCEWSYIDFGQNKYWQLNVDHVDNGLVQQYSFQHLWKFISNSLIIIQWCLWVHWSSNLIFFQSNIGYFTQYLQKFAFLKIVVVKDWFTSPTRDVPFFQHTYFEMQWLDYTRSFTIHLWLNKDHEYMAE